MKAEGFKDRFALAYLPLILMMGDIIGQASQHTEHVTTIEPIEMDIDDIAHVISVGSPHFSVSFEPIWSRACR